MCHVAAASAAGLPPVQSIRKASAQLVTGFLAYGSAGNPKSWSSKANHKVLSLVFLVSFATDKFSRHFK